MDFPVRGGPNGMPQHSKQRFDRASVMTTGRLGRSTLRYLALVTSAFPRYLLLRARRSFHCRWEGFQYPPLLKDEQSEEAEDCVQAECCDTGKASCLS